MPIHPLLAWTAAPLCLALAVLVWLRQRRSFAHRSFAAGLAVLGLEQLLNGLSFPSPEGDLLYWQQMRLMVMALLPGLWLLFTLSFGLADRRITGQWKWIIAASFIVPLGVVAVDPRLLGQSIYLIDRPDWAFRLSQTGYLLHVCFLLGAILVLVNLERILRSSLGRVRWQVKFMVLGLGSLFALRIYTGSQAVLYSAITSTWEVANAVGLLITMVPLVVFLRRTHVFKFDLYPSSTVLYRSITVLVTGIYLLAVGLLVQVLQYFRSGQHLLVEATLVFAALLVLSVALLSDRVRQSIRIFVSRHFKRPTHDYRRIWNEFTYRTASHVEEKDLCRAVTEIVSDVFQSLSVNLWVLEPGKEQMRLMGSTALNESQAADLDPSGRCSARLLEELRRRPEILDLRQEAENEWMREINEMRPGYFDDAHIRYLVPLRVREDLLGALTLEDRVRNKSLSYEDLELLEVLANQSAAALLNLRLSRRLQQARQLEAFQNMAAFFMHDLKNLASRLSLTVQNLPVHFENAQFREDALRAISQSVLKIKDLCSRLSLLRKRVELHPSRVDLNDLLKDTLAQLNGSLKNPVIEELDALPPVWVDREQIQNVLVNLLLNASEASDRQGKIWVQTRSSNGQVSLSVRDNGCGISKEFMEKQLFVPFQTTKSKGMGIGLFHSKMIIEEHRGTIQAESEVGKGTTFRLTLPTLEANHE